MEQHSIQYGQSLIHFGLTYGERKTMSIAVHPDKSVSVKAPVETALEDIKSRVLKRAPWINKQIRFFEQFDPRTPPREYVGGESHRYLGRQYRLKIQQGNKSDVSLRGGYFFITCPSKKPDKIKALLEGWYAQKWQIIMPSIFEECWKRMHLPDWQKPHVKIRKLKRRWGSLSTSGRLTLNFDLIKAPKECIEYVLIHELCHIVHGNHGAEFYKLMGRILPDWQRRKQKLETILS